VTDEKLLQLASGTDERADRLIGRVREQIEPFWPVL